MIFLMATIPFLAALFIPFLHKRIKNIHTGWFVTIVPIVLFGYFLTHFSPVWRGEPVFETISWVPSLGIDISFFVDGLGLLFSLLITGIGSLIVLYSIYYLDKSEQLGHFYVYLLLFMGAMLGIVLSDNIFVLYVFWELTSLSSFLLIGYWHHRERSRYGAQKSMLITVFGGLAMLGGFVLLYSVTGTASIRGIIEQAPLVIESGLFVWILLLILLGAFTKSAQFPFHIWLPDAMEAPTPVSAYLHSATMVKAGIYLIARFSLIFSGTDLFFILVSGFGLLTLCWASYMAVKQTDLKGILAFSTVSQLGMIMAMLGFGTGAAVLAAIFHIFNHATFKGSLFMVAGIVDHETGTRDIRRLGGLMTLMPITATLAIFGTFSMAGVPLPLNGFLSKEMFFDATLEIESGSAIVNAVTPYFPVIAVVGSIFTFVYSMMLFFKTFTGRQREPLEKKPHDPPIGMLVSPIILVAFVIVIGLVPNIINESLLAPAVASITGEVPHIHLAYWHGFNLPLYMSLAVLVAGTLLYITKERWQNVYRFLPGKLSANKLYDSTYSSMFCASEKITRTYMTGSLRHYMMYILLFLIVFVSWTIVRTNGFHLSTTDLARTTLPEVIIAATILMAAIGTIFLRNRIAAILVLGVVGFGVSLLFAFFRAPDLALTQLSIEAISVVLFLLCFYHLPNIKRPTETKSRTLFNLAISLSVGVLVTLIAISSHSTKLFEPISDYFIENSYKLGGGNNIVNVILVDMRGLDTLFEITVLGLAGLGVYAMIKLRKEREDG